MMRYFGLKSFVLLALLLAPSVASAAGTDQTGSRALPAGDYTFTLVYDGANRSYLVHMPPQVAQGAPLPLVLNLHGAGSNARQEEEFSKMDGAADRHGFIAVYPNGTGRLDSHFTWNAGFCCGYAMMHRVDDVGFVVAVIDDVAARTAVERRRVYATGMSNGAMMSYRLASQAADHIAAIAPVAGSVVTRDFAPTHPMPVMAFNSVDDPLLHYSGGYGRQVHSLFHRNAGNGGVEAGIEKWRQFDGCPQQAQIAPALSGKPGTNNAGISATRYQWGPCRDGIEVVLWKFAGSGHVWPGGVQGRFEAVLGRSTDLVDANEEMWKFFSNYELPQQ